MPELGHLVLGETLEHREEPPKGFCPERIHASASFGSDPGLSAIFFADGVPAPPGAAVRQGALGATLTGIAPDGAEALYGGDLGRAYVRGPNDAGAPIATEDLATHRALVLPPPGAAFRDLHVSVVPPNSRGFVLPATLALL